MTERTIPATVRRWVLERAGQHCEYCLLNTDERIMECQRLLEAGRYPPTS